MQEMIKTGIVRADEALRIGDEESVNIFASNWWMPLKWAIEVLQKAQKDGLVTNAPVAEFLPSHELGPPYTSDLMNFLQTK